MKIVLAKTAGFCKGVEKAVTKAMQPPINSRCVLGSLVHNDEVIATLKKQGISFENEPKNEFSEFVISAHGIPSFVCEKLKGKTVLDATCPNVRKLFSVSSRCKDDVCLILIGNEEHVEIVNALSYADNCLCLPNDRVDENLLSRIAKTDFAKFILAFQTTTAREIADEYSKRIKQMLGDKVEIADTLCFAVEKRVREAVEIAKQVETIIVIGDRKSANCKTIFEECKKVSGSVYFVESPIDLPFLDVESVGVTAGASVPDSQIERIIEAMKGKK